LHSVSAYELTFKAGGALGAGDSEHVLVAYQNLSGNAEIMDLALTNTAAVKAGGTEATNAATVTLHGSDMVQLTGVSLLSLNPGNVHFVS
jgi:hypothetical protein